MTKRPQNEDLEFVLESGRMGTWDINLEDDTVSCSKVMLSIWGLDEESFNGDRSLLQKKVHPDDLELMQSSINEATEKRSIYELEYRIYPSPGEERWVLSRGRCTYDVGHDKPVRFSGVAYDITDRKEKERIVAEALKARDELYLKVSHEVRNPLSCLALQLEVMDWKLKYDPSENLVTEYIQKQKLQIDRLSNIMDGILSESERIDQQEG